MLCVPGAAQGKLSLLIFTEWTVACLALFSDQFQGDTKNVSLWVFCISVPQEIPPGFG